MTVASEAREPAAERDLPQLDAAQTRGRAADEGTPPRPMPRWIPLLLGAALLAALAAVALPHIQPYLPFDPFDQFDFSDPASPPEAAATPATPTPGVAPLQAQIEAARAQQQAEAAAFDAALAGVRADVARIGEEVQALKVAVDTIRRTTEATPPAESADDLLRAAIDSLALQLDDVARGNRPRSPVKAAARTRARPVAARPLPLPPFEVLALDSWAGEPQVTVRDAAGVRLVTPGQTVGSWRLVDADASRGVLMLRSPRGRTAGYTLAGAALQPVPAADLPTLTVAAEPADARVRVMN